MAARRKASRKKRASPPDAPAPAAERPFKGVLTRINPEGLRELRLLAIDQDTRLQALMIEAINDLLKKHGRRPIAVNPLLDSE